jgi:serine/threonine protein phosphatase PrpC
LLYHAQVPRLRFAARSDVGPVRERNEDRVAVFTPDGLHAGADAFAGTLPADPGAALVVLDGMGGSRSGAMASRMAIEFLAGRLACAWPADPAERAAWFDEAIRRTSDAVNADGTLYAGQGACVAVAVVVGDDVHLLNVGDCRVYHLRGDRLELRTRDDSLINEARDQGMPEADLEKYQRVIVAALGMGAPDPHVQQLRIEPGDVLLLTSDGLHWPLDHAELAAGLHGRDPAAACETLVDLAIRASSDDNISALVARLEP